MQTLSISFFLLFLSCGAIPFSMAMEVMATFSRPQGFIQEKGVRSGQTFKARPWMEMLLISGLFQKRSLFWRGLVCQAEIQNSVSELEYDAFMQDCVDEQFNQRVEIGAMQHSVTGIVFNHYFQN